MTDSRYAVHKMRMLGDPEYAARYRTARKEYAQERKQQMTSEEAARKREKRAAAARRKRAELKEVTQDPFEIMLAKKAKADPVFAKKLEAARASTGGKKVRTEEDLERYLQVRRDRAKRAYSKMKADPDKYAAYLESKRNRRKGAKDDNG